MSPEAAIARVLAAVSAGGRLRPPARVLIDGGSGAGKTTLARRLAAAWPSAGDVQLVSLDALYPGWDGLDAGVEIARRDILLPHAAGRPGRWRRWDWTLGRPGGPGDEHVVDPARPLIVEGCGILTADTVRFADAALWLQVPEPVRRARALARDGEAYRPHWERWARQERRHRDRDRPAALATIHVDAG